MTKTAARLPPFQRFLDTHSADVLRFLVASVGRHDADDAFQETFLSALRAYPRLPAGSNLRGWVLTIAHHKAIDIHRGRGRNPVPVAAIHEGAQRSTSTPAGEAEGDHWERVRALPARQREVLTLRYVAGMTHAEIASALGCTEQAARRAAADGLKKLRKELIDVAATA